MGERPYSVSVAGVTVDDAGRILVVRRRDNGHWEPPGGVLEPDEAIPDGVTREIREETGVDVAVGDLTGIYQNLTRRVIALVYRCRPIAGSATPTEEAADVRWIERDDVDSLMVPAYAIRIHDAFTGGTPTRLHDGEHLLP